MVRLSDPETNKHYYRAHSGPSAHHHYHHHNHIHKLHEFADAYVGTCVSCVIDDMPDGAHLHISIDGGGDVASSSCDVSESHMSAALAAFSTHEDCPYFHGFFGQGLNTLQAFPLLNCDSMDAETMALILAMLYIISNIEKHCIELLILRFVLIACQPFIPP